MKAPASITQWAEVLALVTVASGLIWNAGQIMVRVVRAWLKMERAAEHYEELEERLDALEDQRCQQNSKPDAKRRH